MTIITNRHNTEGTYGHTKKQYFPKRWPLRYLTENHSDTQKVNTVQKLTPRQTHRIGMVSNIKFLGILNRLIRPNFSLRLHYVRKIFWLSSFKKKTHTKNLQQHTEHTWFSCIKNKEGSKKTSHPLHPRQPLLDTPSP